MADKVPNKERGEIAITLAGQPLVMRPTPDCAVAIEARTGKGLRALGRRVVDGEATLTELSAVIFEGLRAAGEPAVYATVRDAVFKAGYVAIEVPALQLIVNLATGGRQEAEATGEAKAAETTN